MVNFKRKKRNEFKNETVLLLPTCSKTKQHRWTVKRTQMVKPVARSYKGLQSKKEELECSISEFGLVLEKRTIYEAENLKEQEDYWKTAFFFYEVRSSHWHKATGWCHITKQKLESFWTKNKS
ncbi:hypothetical protein H5410_021105 [Solanum commersonii]|uniref:Uncharacterized protein n=1 Tax=Solanum commersonii TaxID=4109 RepID=A0A9J5ZDA4_SOLCO|nr:hypothetical protein H5410_021105 [Solanum commersonii]